MIGDQFGISVCIADNIVVVGAPFVDSEFEDTGAVYVFRFDGNTWTEEQKLLPSTSAEGMGFGRSVSVNLNMIVIGTETSGTVYVYRHDGVAWNQEAVLVPWDGEGEGFGSSVDVDDDIIIVGAYFDSGICVGCGSAYVFEFDGVGWEPTSKLVANDALSGWPVPEFDMFGFSVAVQSDIAVVGKPRNIFPFPWGEGAAYVFHKIGNTWIEESKLVPSNSRDGDLFGSDVDTDGLQILVGASKGTGNSLFSGSAHIFQQSDLILGGSWMESSFIIDPNSDNDDNFGSDVAMGNMVALIGGWSPNESEDEPSAYSAKSGTWEFVTYLNRPNTDGDRDYCRSLALDGQTAVVGSVSPWGSLDPGIVYIFNLSEECHVFGDVNGDGVVNVLDLLVVIDYWGLCEGICPADMNLDGVVDVTDLLIVIDNWD